MKKFSFYILATLIITNIFVPLSLVINNGIKVEKNVIQAADCEVLSAVWVPAGEQDDGFFTEKKTGAIIRVKTKDCVGAPGITLTVFEEDTCFFNCDDGLSGSNLQRKKIDVPSDNFRIKISLGEEECDWFGFGYDCHLFFYLRQADDILYNSWDKNDGKLLYECQGLACLENGNFLGVVAEGTDSNPIPIEPDEAPVSSDETYTLLAPIGSLTEVKSAGGTCLTNKEISNGIGCYLNTIFLIAIGLCGALAVIMIIISGVQYMGDESVFGKTEAKSKILSAILGLLIALGSYALLKTINPDLTGSNGVTIDQVEAEIDEDPILSDANTPVPTGATNKFSNCPGGVRKTSTTGGDFIVCSTFATKFQQMLSDAYHSTPSIALSGGGFRTREAQIALYQKNCGGGTRKCNPPTAKPGTSMHESGLAFDLKCDGKLINFDGKQRRFAQTPATKKCFDWLTANAGKYGLYNFKRENWHWSTNGK